MFPARISMATLVVALAAAAPSAPVAPSVPPSASEANALRAKKAWDELYLRFSTAKPDGFESADRKAIAAAFLEASQALGGEPALAVACAERSADFAPSVEAWLAAGDADLKLKQLAAAASAYEKALQLAPTHARALLSRADLAMQDGEPGLAASLYAKVPGSAPESKLARGKQAKAELAEKERAQSRLALGQLQAKAPVQQAKPRPRKEDPAAVSYEAVCSESMRGICGLVRRCLPGDPSAATCDDTVDAQCAKLDGLTAVSRGTLDACIADLARAPCGQFLSGVRTLAELSPGCAPVQQALDRLDTPGP